MNANKNRESTRINPGSGKRAEVEHCMGVRTEEAASFRTYSFA